MSSFKPADRYEQEIMDFVHSRPHFTYQDVADRCSASDWKRENTLRRMRDQGVFREVGKEGRKKVLTVLSDEALEAAQKCSDPAQIDRDWMSQRLNLVLSSVPSSIEAAPSYQPSKEEQELLGRLSELAHFSQEDLKRFVPANSAMRNNVLAKLKRHGLVHVWGGRGNSGRYTVHSPKDAQRKAREMRQSRPGAMWTAMRGHRQFTPVDVLASIASARPDIALRHVEEYCKLLQRAGYVRVLRKQTKHLPARYLLIRNTGPLPPTSQSMPVIIDPNEDAVVYARGKRLA